MSSDNNNEITVQDLLPSGQDSENQEDIKNKEHLVTSGKIEDIFKFINKHKTNLPNGEYILKFKDGSEHRIIVDGGKVDKLEPETKLGIEDEESNVNGKPPQTGTGETPRKKEKPESGKESDDKGEEGNDEKKKQEVVNSEIKVDKNGHTKITSSPTEEQNGETTNKKKENVERINKEKEVSGSTPEKRSTSGETGDNGSGSNSDEKKVEPETEIGIDDGEGDGKDSSGKTGDDEILQGSGKKTETVGKTLDDNIDEDEETLPLEKDPINDDEDEISPRSEEESSEDDGKNGEKEQSLSNIDDEDEISPLPPLIIDDDNEKNKRDEPDHTEKETESSKKETSKKKGEIKNIEKEQTENKKIEGEDKSMEDLKGTVDSYRGIQKKVSEFIDKLDEVERSLTEKKEKWPAVVEDKLNIINVMRENKERLKNCIRNKDEKKIRISIIAPTSAGKSFFICSLALFLTNYKKIQQEFELPDDDNNSPVFGSYFWVYPQSDEVETLCPTEMVTDEKDIFLEQKFDGRRQTMYWKNIREYFEKYLDPEVDGVDLKNSLFAFLGIPDNTDITRDYFEHISYRKFSFGNYLKGKYKFLDNFIIVDLPGWDVDPQHKERQELIKNWCKKSDFFIHVFDGRVGAGGTYIVFEKELLEDIKKYNPIIKEKIMIAVFSKLKELWSGDGMNVVGEGTVEKHRGTFINKLKDMPEGGIICDARCNRPNQIHFDEYSGHARTRDEKSALVQWLKDCKNFDIQKLDNNNLEATKENKDFDYFMERLHGFLKTNLNDMISGIKNTVNEMEITGLKLDDVTLDRNDAEKLLKTIGVKGLLPFGKKVKQEFSDNNQIDWDSGEVFIKEDEDKDNDFEILRRHDGLKTFIKNKFKDNPQMNKRLVWVTKCYPKIKEMLENQDDSEINFDDINRVVDELINIKDEINKI